MPRLPIRSLSFALGVCAVSALAVITLRALASGVGRDFSWRRAASRLRAGAVLLAAFGILCGAAAGQTTHEWAWMGGASVIQNLGGGAAGVYGTMGTPAGANLPGSRVSAASWTDKSGNLWLFGGLGYDIGDNKGVLNDLWMYNPLTNLWTWISGNDYAAPKGVYGTLGVAAAGNTPGGRSYPVSWTDSSGNFWLFGGIGLDGSGSYGNLNDLWRFSPSTAEWTWVSGSSSVGSGCGGGTCGQDGVYGTLGKAAAANVPGGRNSAVAWTDKSGRLWLFGGFGHDASDNSGFLDDLWEFNPSTSQWTWMGGYNSVGSGSNHPGVYGTKGTAAAGNFPGTRGESAAWTDSAGNLWLFGGYGYDSKSQAGYLNDLWEFNPTANQWTWVGGSSTGGGSNPQGGVYGTIGTPAAGNIPGGRYQALNWTDGAGHLWLFGGNAYDSVKAFSLLDDLWEFDPTTNQWTWMGGLPNANYDGGWSGVYGTLGVPAAGNIPGSRFGSACWTDSYGNLWLWGGNGFDINQTPGYPNDLWKYQLVPPAANPTFSPAAGTYLPNLSVTLADNTPGASIYYTTDGTTPSPASTRYTGAIKVSASETITAIAFADGYSNSAVVAAAYKIVSILPAATPTFTPAAGAYKSAQTVTISDATSGATIYYTADGSTPTISSARYTGAIAVPASMTLKAIATASGWATSAVGVAAYTINDGTYQWAWMGGRDVVNQGGVYGTLGVPSAGNAPGARNGSASWTGRNGHFWLFGGGGYDYNNVAGALNDLWEFDPSTNQWAWMAGSNAVGSHGVYGTLGVAAAGNSPGSRQYAVSWIDKSGHFWLFGGLGHDSNGTTGQLNDLWELDPSTNLWTWISGSKTAGGAGVYGKLGTAAAGNLPGARDYAVGWTDSSGNLWLFGGLGFDAQGNQGRLNDLWEFAASTKAWTWIGGSNLNGQLGVYGTLGTPAPGNIPGGRAFATGWTGKDGNFWLFGGNGEYADYNDLWEFNPSTRDWTWVSGSNLCTSGPCTGVYGTLRTPAAGNVPGGRVSASGWADANGNLWLFGGSGFDGGTGTVGLMNDLWEFNPSAKQWTWVSGSSRVGANHGQSGVYGTLGTPAAADVPGGRNFASNWIDSRGNLWLFGGIGFDVNGTDAYLNDLWKYQPFPTVPAAATPTFSVPGGTYTTAQSVSIADTTKGAAIYYTTDGSTPTISSTKYTAAIKVSATETLQAVAVAAGYANSWVASATYSITTGPAAAPTFSPAAGTYATAPTVTIATAAPGATIYYTTDGTTPTTGSTKYAGAIKVSSSQTLTAIAVAPGYLASPPATAQYVIGTPQTTYVYTVAGNGIYGYAGDGGQATLAQVAPYKAVADSAGNLYIADTNNNRVRKVAAGTGVITTVAGSGVQGFSGDNGPAVNAQLTWVTSIALDGAGYLYICDTGANIVRRVNLATGTIATYAGSPDWWGFGGDGKAATSAQLAGPAGIALDSAGNLYIADTGNARIRKVAAATGIITTVAGNGTTGSGGDGGPATAANLNNPKGLAVDGAGNLYIADTGNNVVRMVSASGKIATFAGKGVAGYGGDSGPATSAQLNQPSDVAVDSLGNLFIADYTNGVVRKVAAGTGIIGTVAGQQQYACQGTGQDGGVASAARFCNLDGVSVDTADNLYVADNGDARIRKVNTLAAAPVTAAAAPVFSLAAGTYAAPQTAAISDATPGAAIYYSIDGSTPNGGYPGYGHSIGVTSSVTLSAIAIAPGYLPSAPAVARYVVTSAPASVIQTYAGNGSWGFTGMGGAATSAQIGSPQGVATDSSGNVYFADIGNNVVWKVTAKTGIITVAAGTGKGGYSGDKGPAASAQLNTPSGIALDTAGNLYIADQKNNAVRKVTAATGVIATVAGNGTAGSTGNGGQATAAELNNPTAVALDSAGNLYISDTNNSLVRKVTANTGVITTFAGNGNWYSGDGGPATSAGVGNPQGLAFDSAGNLYILDATPRVRKVAAGTGIVTTVAGSGAWGYSGDGGPATSAEISAGQGNGGYIAFDAANNLYLSNNGGVVREVSAATGVINTIAGSGIWGSFGDGGTPTLAEMAGAAGVAFDKAGNLFIADSFNSRVRAVLPGNPAPTPAFSLAAGKYAGTQTVSITDSLGGATIRYTTDGSAPTAGSPLYSGQVIVAASETLSAVATAPGRTPSAMASAAYIISTAPKAATPTFSLAAGTYPTALNVAIASATPGAVVYYSTDGTTPGSGSTKYTAAIKVSANETLQAIAIGPGYSTSAVASASYAINPLAVGGKLQWTWMGGSSTLSCWPEGCGATGVYGTLGKPAAGNIPAGRDSNARWTDPSGNFWFFGGWVDEPNGSYGELNDLWRFNPSTKQWTWMGGSSTFSPCTTGFCGPAGVYGKQGTPDAGNIPGGRGAPITWTDSKGRFWLFGGWGPDSTGTYGTLNDLWEFDPTANQWTWMGGSKTVPAWSGNSGVYGTKGTSAAGNLPGSRSDAVTWQDAGGNFWLYGGNGYDASGNSGYLSDLWEFNPSTGQWTWVGGNSTMNCPAGKNTGCGQQGVYGTLGVAAAANWPGSRSGATFWKDSSGNLWLFGGNGFDINGHGGTLNDLWEWNATTKQWAWMNGSSFLYCGGIGCGIGGTFGTLGSFGPENAPGARIDAAVWTDSAGNAWLLGGQGNDSIGNYGTLNDLWEYKPSINQWAWMGGASTMNCGASCGAAGTYGTLGTPNGGNMPGGRTAAMHWTDSSGNLWLFAGKGNDSGANSGELNDLWKFQP